MVNKFGRLPIRAVKKALRLLCKGIEETLLLIPYFRFIKDTRISHQPRLFSVWFLQKIVGFNREAYWPVHFSSRINLPRRIIVGVNSNPGVQPGCYIQGIGKLVIGDYCYFGPNIGIISANHDLYNLDEYDKLETRIGSYCWIGMNAVVLPGVVLGDYTIVAAGSVVTKSFPEGHCVIAGNPARKIKDLDPEKCIRKRADKEYIGYIQKAKFEEFKNRYLQIA